MEDHVNWPTQMGARVLINDGWYKSPQYSSGKTARWGFESLMVQVSAKPCAPTPALWLIVPSFVSLIVELGSSCVWWLRQS